MKSSLGVCQDFNFFVFLHSLQTSSSSVARLLLANRFDQPHFCSDVQLHERICDRLQKALLGLPYFSLLECLKINEFIFSET